MTSTLWLPDPTFFEHATTHGASISTALCESIAVDIKEQRLLPGDMLPTQRLLARRMAISLGTVHRAYQEATHRGLIRGEVGRGCFILETRTQSSLSRLALTRTNTTEATNGERRSCTSVDLSRNLSLPLSLPTLLHRELRDAISAVTVADYLRRDAAGGSDAAKAAGSMWIGSSRHDETLVVGGAQLALNVIFSALTVPGDCILADALSFPGLRLAAQLHRLRVVPLTGTSNRPEPEVLRAAIVRHKPKLWFTIPTLHNPTASIMPDDLRRSLAGVANKAGLVVVEDDVYGFLARETISLAVQCEQGIRLVSMAKSTLAGLRIAYLNSSPTIAQKLVSAIEALCWMAPPASAALASTLIANGIAMSLAEWKQRELTIRLATARNVLGRRLLCEADASLHGWLMLPTRWNPSSFTEACAHRGVLVSPADEFLSTPKATSPNAVRISFGTTATVEELEGALVLVAELLAARPVSQRDGRPVHK
jgi:DNA-binding transcriptional MocR family regulator